MKIQSKHSLKLSPPNFLKRSPHNNSLAPPNSPRNTRLSFYVFWRFSLSLCCFSLSKARVQSLFLQNQRQDAHKRSNNWLPPPWAIVAMIVLGFNEFMLLLKIPLYLLALFVIYLLSKALWVQLDITGEFQHGTNGERFIQGH